MIMESMPRPITSTHAPSISAQTRTQRVQRMQRLWSMVKRSCDVYAQFGIAVGKTDVSKPLRLAKSLQIAMAIGPQTEQM
jgi:hypothetical protein